MKNLFIEYQNSLVGLKYRLLFPQYSKNPFEIKCSLWTAISAALLAQTLTYGTICTCIMVGHSLRGVTRNSEWGVKDQNFLTNFQWIIMQFSPKATQNLSLKISDRVVKISTKQSLKPSGGGVQVAPPLVTPLTKIHLLQIYGSPQ